MTSPSTGAIWLFISRRAGNKHPARDEYKALRQYLDDSAALLASQEAEIAELKNVIENGNWGDKWRKRAEAAEAEIERLKSKRDG